MVHNMPTCVVEVITGAKEKGKSKYGKYVEERLNTRSKPITDTLQRCNFVPYQCLVHLRNDSQVRQVIKFPILIVVALFFRLHIACQARERNLEELFKQENSSSLLALSCNEKMHTGQKSDLITCIEVNTAFERPSVDAVVLDGAAIVNMLPPGKCTTFKDYKEAGFLPYIISYCTQNVKGIDLVWDRYLENSLKQGTREVRGTGTCRHVCDDAAIPLNSKSFLRLDDNKKELFEYLAARVQSLRLPDSEVICTAALDVIGSTTMEGMAPCNHEETDTHIFIHAKHASVNGMKRTLIRTVDTDVVILDVEELWIAFEVGKHLHYLSIHLSR